MNRYLLLSVLIYTLSICKLSAQNYSVAGIPDSLKENSYCVIREYTRNYELKSINSATLTIKKVVTVLVKEGDNKAGLNVSYDKNSKVSIKDIIIYDSNGKKIKSVKQSEIGDSPAYGSSELYSENRMKYYSPTQTVYPYTISYELEESMDNVISFGVWKPFSDYNVSLQHSSYTFSHPADVKINKKELNVHSKPQMSDKNIISETWEISNMKAIDDEPMDISLDERVPRVYIMPDRLIYEKYEGTAGSWQEFGKWIYSLYQGRDELSEAEKAKIDLLLKEVPDTLEKIKTLYKYMQGSTRYVAVTLGIGGFQPFDTKTVFETGYGDCKALSNYMYSLLRHTGIKSFPALVAAGAYKVPIFVDFPNFLQFNHVILCVPFRKDTIWLECTSQKMPFGFLGDFTDNRDVLLFDKTGGKFAHTTKYEAKDNIRICRSEFMIDSEGTATGNMNTVMKGLQYNNVSFLFSSNYDEQKKWLYGNSTLPSLQINNFSISESRETIPEAFINESSASRKFCSFSGNYMILPLNPVNSQSPLKKMLKPRYSDILINRSYIDYDTIVYRLPKNLKPEALPAGGYIDSPFGSCTWSVSGNGNEITYVRKMVINEGRYKPSEYNSLYDFILKVSKADNTKVLLSKK